MLTDEGINERKWGEFPSLGKLLGKCPVSSSGPISTSDSYLGWLNRMAEIAVTIREHADTILTVTDAELFPLLTNDLREFENALQSASHFFTEHQKFVRSFVAQVYVQEERRRRLEFEARQGGGRE